MLRTSDLTVSKFAKRDKSQEFTTLTKQYVEINMLLTLLLVARVGCEWIQISQQNYRKPIRPNHQNAQTEIIREKEFYGNLTASEYKWNNEPDPNSSGTRKAVPDINIGYKGYQLENVAEDFAHTARKESSRNVERISHIGRIDRVQLINTSVKSSNVNNFQSGIKIKENNTKFKTGFERPFRKTNNNNFQIKHVNTEVNTETASENYRSVLKPNSYENISEYELKNITKDESTDDVFITNQFQRIPDITSENLEQTIKYNRQEDQDPYSNRKVESINSLPNLTSAHNEQLKTKNNIDSNEENYNSQHIKPEIRNNSDSTTEKYLTIIEKSDAAEVIVKFIKVVSDSISSNTRRSFTSKVQYLEDLKDTIMANIEDRIDATWADKPDRRHRRSQPSENATRGHVEFPSSESTLMSISFLTFAVFLIKLVLQVIQTYKNKTMMVAPLVLATAGRAALDKLNKMKHN